MPFSILQNDPKAKIGFFCSLYRLSSLIPFFQKRWLQSGQKANKFKIIFVLFRKYLLFCIGIAGLAGFLGFTPAFRTMRKTKTIFC